MEVIDRLHSTVATKHKEVESEQRDKAVVKYFDGEFRDLLSFLGTKAQISHDANLFIIVCQNIKNDLLSIDTYIKEL